MSVLVTALCNQPEASDLGDDQSHYLLNKMLQTLMAEDTATQFTKKYTGNNTVTI